MKQVNIIIQNVSFYSNLVFASGQFFHKATEKLPQRQVSPKSASNFCDYILSLRSKEHDVILRILLKTRQILQSLLFTLGAWVNLN